MFQTGGKKGCIVAMTGCADEKGANVKKGEKKDHSDNEVEDEQRMDGDMSSDK